MDVLRLILFLLHTSLFTYGIYQVITYDTNDVLLMGLFNIVLNLILGAYNAVFLIKES